MAHASNPARTHLIATAHVCLLRARDVATKELTPYVPCAVQTDRHIHTDTPLCSWRAAEDIWCSTAVS